MSEHETVTTASSRPSVRLGYWNVYFIVKLVLYAKGLLGFNPLYNLAFAVALAAPIQHAGLRMARHVAGAVMAIALLYHDSWLPPLSQLTQQTKLIGAFSMEYMLELAGRVVQFEWVLGIFLLVAAYHFVSRYLRVGTLLVLGMSGLLFQPILQAAFANLSNRQKVAEPAVAAEVVSVQPQNLNTRLNERLAAFYQSEAQRVVTMPEPLAGSPDFDVFVVHICSLSWDDLAAIGLENVPLLNRFDIVFRQFNSVTTYSGPAAVRTLRATCGQQSHTQLFDPASADCYLFGSLERRGFKTSLAINHDGHFEDFLQLVQKQQGMSKPPQPLNGIPVAMHSFDGSPIYDDGAVFKRWLAERQRDTAARVATYYNTISLHDGNRMVGINPANQMESYRKRSTRLFADLNMLIEMLQQSGRRTVLMLVPEHGAALRGDKYQFSGLREIPSPSIALAPAAIKVIGPNLPKQTGPVVVNDPVSMLAMSHVLAGMLKTNPFTEEYNPSAYLADVPQTPYVAENQNFVMIKEKNNYFFKQKSEDSWQAYMPEQ